LRLGFGYPSERRGCADNRHSAAIAQSQCHRGESLRVEAMIDMLDHLAEYEASIAQANTFARRKCKGIPSDRWATEDQSPMVADGIRALNAIISLQTAALIAMQARIDAMEGAA
jgi:hypothetical protein